MPSSRARGRGRDKRTAQDGPAEIYQEMLGEALQAGAGAQSQGIRARKRRKVAEHAAHNVAIEKEEEVELQHRDPGSRATTKSASPEPRLQAIQYNPEKSDDDEDAFEDVEIRENGPDTDEVAEGPMEDGGSLNLVLKEGEGHGRGTTLRRRVNSAIADKRLVLQIHKLHVLCLISHASLRNHWCNDVQIHRTLRKLVPKKARLQLQDDETDDQFTRDQKLRAGLQHMVGIFKELFTIKARGLRRAWWDAPENKAEPPSSEDLDVLTSLDDFQQAAMHLEGSRDVGAQLFCAMLRAVGLEVRLVCSLQPLPLSGALRPDQQQNVGPAQIIRYEETRAGMSGRDKSPGPGYYPISMQDDTNNDEDWRVVGIRRKLAGRLGKTPVAGPKSPQPNLPSKTRPPIIKRFRESPCPVYWAEVFTPAYQKWIAVDSLVTEALGRPSKLEPAQKDIRNCMSYVLGFEDDGSIRDVTKRYASTYNAKTRKTRVDAMADSPSARWWKILLRLYRRQYPMDRDSIEDVELQQREAREGMPKNIEDFKGHPLYVLERHLRRSEVLHPKVEVGKTGGKKVGSAADKLMESVYRRQHVHQVRSADAWYKLGRKIKIGEQPLKRVVPKRGRERKSLTPGADEPEDGEEGRGLYAVFQTEIYRAPPVSNGRVPRNTYGNLDVYVPSMIPPGAIHVLHQDAKHAARILGIDYVDAVTGFEFRGRHGSAVVNGVIIAAEYKDAMVEVMRGFEDERLKAEASHLTREILRLWRRFMIGLSIQERVASYTGTDKEENENMMGEIDMPNDEMEDVDYGGGFVPEPGQDDCGPPAISQPLPVSHSWVNDKTNSNFIIIEGPSLHQNLQPDDFVEAGAPRSCKSEPAYNEAENGGFMPEDAKVSYSDKEEGDSFVRDEKPIWPDGSITGSGTTTQVSRLDHEEGQVLGPCYQPKQRHHDTENVRKSDNTKADGLSNLCSEQPNISRSNAGIRLEEFDSQHSETVKIDDSDHGSLLSEDPEDADADPDWLG